MSSITVSLLFISVGLFYMIGLLGAMAWMASNAAKNSSAAISLVPPQENLLNQVQTFALQNKYVLHSQKGSVYTFRKGRGLLTSLTELKLTLLPDNGAHIEVNEVVNFLFKLIHFPINAPTFLGLPIRKRKLKNLNLLLQNLKATPITMSHSTNKKIKLKK